MPQKITYRLKRDKLPGGDEIWTGYLDIPTFAAPTSSNASRPKFPLYGPKIRLKATESSPRKAMGSATSAAFKLLDNPAVRDMLPPGTQSAIAVAKKLASSKGLKNATKSAAKFVSSLF